MFYRITRFLMVMITIIFINGCKVGDVNNPAVNPFDGDSDSYSGDSKQPTAVNHPYFDITLVPPSISYVDIKSQNTLIFHFDTNLSSNTGVESFVIETEADHFTIANTNLASDNKKIYPSDVKLSPGGMHVTLIFNESLPINTPLKLSYKVMKYGSHKQFDGFLTFSSMKL